MACMSPHTLREIIVRTRESFRRIDHEDWNPAARCYHTPNDTAKWEQAARENAPHEWCEFVRILAQGWDYLGGGDLPGEGRR